MTKLVQAYFEEAIWLKEKYIPTMEEYMSKALISCAYPTLNWHHIFYCHGRYRDQGSIGMGYQGAKDCKSSINHMLANG